MYSCYAQRISFEISCFEVLISKEISRAEHEYMNVHMARFYCQNSIVINQASTL